MSSTHASAETATALVGQNDPGGFDRIRIFTGNYYRVLGWASLAAMIVSIATVYWTDSLHLDFSFVFLFYLGSCLKEGRPAARKWAIAIFYIVTAFVALGSFIPGATASFGSFEFDRSHPAFLAISGLMWLVFAVPAILLMSCRGRAEFARTERGEQDAGDQAPAAVD